MSIIKSKSLKIDKGYDMEQTIPINVLKTQCYQLAQQVSHEHLNLIITKHGKPIIRVSPYQLPPEGKLNALKGTAIWNDDLISPTETDWNVMQKDMYVRS